MTYRSFFVSILLIVFSAQMHAQLICGDSKKEILLRNGNKVKAYRSKDNAQLIYYVPTQFRVSDKNGRLEYAFQPYKKGGSTTSDGAIFNMLITWGLNKADLQILNTKVKQQFGPNTKVAGSMDLKSTSNNIIFNSDPISRILKSSLTSNGFPPTTGTSKMSMSFKIPKQHVKTISDALKNKSKFGKASLQMNYKHSLYSCKSSLNGGKIQNIKITGYLTKMF